MGGEILSPHTSNILAAVAAPSATIPPQVYTYAPIIITVVGFILYRQGGRRENAGMEKLGGFMLIVGLATIAPHFIPASITLLINIGAALVQFFTTAFSGLHFTG